MHAERVDREQERAAAVVEGVQEDLDLVVGVDVVAVGERRAHDVPMGLVRANPEVDRVRTVKREHLRAVLRRPAIDGAVLREAGEQRRLLPGRFIEDAIDVHRRRVDARHAHLDPMEAAVVHRSRIARGLQEKEKHSHHGGKICRETRNGKRETLTNRHHVSRFPYHVSRYTDASSALGSIRIAEPR